MAAPGRVAAYAACCLWLALGVAAQKEVRPVDKVITLLRDLKAKVEQEATDEAQLYDQFSCFCKTTTAQKSSLVTSTQTAIDDYAADIEQWTAEKDSAAVDLSEKTAQQEATNQELEAVKTRCKKEEAEFDVAKADLDEAITSLGNAIQAMLDSKPKDASLIAIRKGVANTLQLADTMGMLKAPARKTLSAFLQQKSGADPAEYQYRSQDVIDLLQKLETDFNDQKTDLVSEYGKSSKLCTDEQKELSGKLGNADKAIKGLGGEISKKGGDIAGARTSLLEAEASMKDAQLYLKDLTMRCEDRARDWDQRSVMRADEVKAITKALDILTETVQPTDAVNVRALLQKAKAAPSSAKQAPRPASQQVPPHAASAKPARPSVDAARREVASVSLLQRVSDHHPAPHAGSFLAAKATEGQRTTRALDMLQKEGDRLQSVVLSALAARLQADPFSKVKELIQDLIERLLREATAEATKKGFCDTEVGKAEQERDTRFEETLTIAAEVNTLKAKIDELEASIKECTEQAALARTALGMAESLREQEKEENANITATAEEGLEAVKEAKAILMEFYGSAAKATVLAQRKASPVDEDTSGPGFEGAYQGQQGGVKAVIGLLEVLASDYERTIRKTKELESQAAADYVKLDRSSKADIASKEMQAELDGQELNITKTKKEQREADLVATQGVLDAALQSLEDLRPVCIDTGMSYAERVARREDEIVALKKALCILDPEGVEEDCPTPKDAVPVP